MTNNTSKGREEYILNNSVILPMDTESITWEELFI